MRIEELSIGDWVCYTGKCIDGIGLNRKITYIERDACGLLIGLDYGGFHYSSAKIEDISPIPLTPEILEKNGFAFKHKGIEFDHYETNLENGKTLLLSFDRGEHYYLMYEEKGERGLHQIDCPLGYVHEMQHAIRLARIEKEIEV